MKKKDFIKIIEAGYFYMLVGSLISADNLVDEDSCTKALEVINDLDKNCNLLTSEDFPVGEIEKFKEYIIRGRDIINRELVNFKK